MILQVKNSASHYRNFSVPKEVNTDREAGIA
jgi:hypothetical protein